MKLKDGIDRESCLSEIKRRLEKLVDSIDEIRRFEVGINVSRSPNASDLALYSEFDSQESLNRYREHPRHQEVLAYLKEVLAEIRVVDYER